MDTSGFFRKQGNEIQVAPNFVHGPGFSLSRDTHAEHTYPTDGWYWFDDEDAARTALFAVDASRALSRADFIRRFTIPEWIAANEFAKTDGMMAYGFALLAAVDEVNLDNQDTINLLGYMTIQGLLTAERSLAIRS